MKLLAKTKNMSKEEWLKIRRCGVSGSDAPIVMGDSNYRSILELYRDKRGEIPIEEIENEYTHFGHVLEQVIRKEFQQRTGLTVRTKNYLLQSSEYPWLIGNVDGIVKESDGTCSVFEAKTALEYKKSLWESGPSEEYRAQVQHYLALTGYQKCYICALVGGNSFYCYVVERDEAYIKELVQREKAFWDCVEKGTPPLPDASKGTTEYLNKTYPIGKKSEIHLPESAEELAEAYLKVEKELKELTKKKDGISNNLKNLLQENECGYAGGRVVTWKTIHKRTLNSGKVKEVLGQSYDEYLLESTYRKFNVA